MSVTQNHIPFSVTVKVGPQLATIEGYITNDSEYRDLTDKQIELKIKEAQKLALDSVLKTRKKAYTP